MTKSWQEAYQDFDSMTVPELRGQIIRMSGPHHPIQNPLSKTTTIHRTGKKMDLIQYLIFKEYPDLGYQYAKTNSPPPFDEAALWVKLKYEMWLDTPEGFLATGRSFDAINHQDINS